MVKKLANQKKGGKKIMYVLERRRTKNLHKKAFRECDGLRTKVALTAELPSLSIAKSRSTS